MWCRGVLKQVLDRLKISLSRLYRISQVRMGSSLPLQKAGADWTWSGNGTRKQPSSRCLSDRFCSKPRWIEKACSKEKTPVRRSFPARPKKIASGKIFSPSTRVFCDLPLLYNELHRFMNYRQKSYFGRAFLWKFIKKLKSIRSHGAIIRKSLWPINISAGHAFHRN